MEPLNSWSNPSRFLDFEPSAKQNEVIEIIEVPVDTSYSAIPNYVHKLMSNLFQAFEGHEKSEQIIDDLVRRLIERRLSSW